MMAAVNEVTVNPVIIRATNQKNTPLTIREKRPSVMILSGSVSMVTIGFTIIFKNTKHAATTIAVSMPLTAIPPTKCGRAKMASVVINQRRRIILK